MIAARLLDVLLVLLLLVYLGEGIRNGFVRSASAILGVVAGGVVAFFLIPVLATIVPDPFWRTFVIVAAAGVLLLGGHGLGALVGRSLRRRRTGLNPIDRFFGGVANLVVAALVIGTIGSGIGGLGIPVLSSAAGNSWVLKAISAATPDPLEAALAQLRSTVLSEGLPTLDLGGPTPTAPPTGPTDTQALQRSAESVVRISGTAYACGQNQSGSGFVVTNGRVVTNAHVVAGVSQPVVEAPNGQALEARIVFFDPEKDLAVLAVPGLQVAPIAMGDTLDAGTDAVVDGYPFGGPFTTGSAKVLAVTRSSVDDIYDRDRVVREIYSLNATVEPGNSGGPLLATDGRIAGIVFARSANQSNLGYAMTDAELSPVVQQAPGLNATVSSGACVKG
ncbi:MarP family serine protease [Pseudolysinimonas sp.]|uniref:MarP family serine protease n=1 Tax=Pseudolysinimonas sp. TaxID=2680009 RepID=UPI003F7EF456